MTNNPKKDGDGKEPDEKYAAGNDEDKPGLTIDFVLPEKSVKDDKELGKRH